MFIHVQSGTDTYGRVKVVGGTPVITKFAMLQFLPLFPVQSYYSFGKGRTNRQGIPFIFRVETVSNFGVPLLRLDRTSVIITFLRGIFGTLAVLGCFAIISAITYLNGGHLDKFAETATVALLGCLAIGLIGGGLTYAIPLTFHRERAIRTFCGEVIGMCIDPALIPSEYADAVARIVDETDSEVGVNDQRLELVKELVRTRAQIAQGNTEQNWELRTDELLDRLPNVGAMLHTED